MKPTLFLSDLHLSPARPESAAAFEAFGARTRARGSGASTSWATCSMRGSATSSCASRSRVTSPARCAASRDAGVPLGVARGNRDFLLGDAFAAATGATLLPEQTLVAIAGTPTLLLHGDELCTDDIEYQRYRALTRDPRYQRRLLAPSVLRPALDRPMAAAQEPSATARKPESIWTSMPAQSSVRSAAPASRG